MKCLVLLQVAYCVLSVAVCLASATYTAEDSPGAVEDSTPDKRGVELGIHSGYSSGAEISGGLV